MTPTKEQLLALAEPRFNARGDSNYEPIFPGIHLCGICIDPLGNEQPYTALNIPAASEEEALLMWEAAKAEASLPDREGEDFLCDLNTVDGHTNDFSTNRQMVPRLIEAALRARAHSQEVK